MREARKAGLDVPDDPYDRERDRGYGGGGGGYGGMPSSYDSGDPFTTNCYVGNLAPIVDEEILKLEFGRWVDRHTRGAAVMGTLYSLLG